MSSSSAREAWLSALSDLEDSLGATAAGRDTDWVAPGNLGPIPADLEDRARDLLVGHDEMIAELRHAQRTTAAHLAALKTVPDSRGAGASVYLDTSG